MTPCSGAHPRAAIRGLVVESTSTWSWLVDGLMEAGDGVHLANPAALQPEDGLKPTEARWLAHLRRLGLLPADDIYPKAQRAVRDRLRQRSPGVRHQTTQRLSLQHRLARHPGSPVRGQRIQPWGADERAGLLPDAARALVVTSNLAGRHGLADQLAIRERTVNERGTRRPAFRQLLPVSGMGDILALTILLETGAIGRFDRVGHFAS